MAILLTCIHFCVSSTSWHCALHYVLLAIVITKISETGGGIDLEVLVLFSICAPSASASQAVSSACWCCCRDLAWFRGWRGPRSSWLASWLPYLRKNLWSPWDPSLNSNSSQFFISSWQTEERKKSEILVSISNSLTWRGPWDSWKSRGLASSAAQTQPQGSEIFYRKGLVFQHSSAQAAFLLSQHSEK